MPREEDVKDVEGILTLETDGFIPVFAFSVAKGDLNYQIIFSKGDPADLAQQFMEAF